ncbi:acyl carrier protein [Haloglycomyces albus]|uniref:acyl carrier protein n=1 Tax=Haloglycomyces albus TaxID=526067 RepID=UPI00046D87F8
MLDLDAAMKDKIKVLICEILELDVDEVTETSLFKEDHDADSLLAIEIVASLEKTFNITIAQSEMTKMVNLAGIYDVVSAAPSNE